MLTGFPLPDAEVTLIAGAGKRIEVRTDGAGRFHFASLDPGLYSVIGRAAGHGCDGVGAVVKPGEVAMAPLLLLPFTGSLAGTVVKAETGEPLAGVSVKIVNSVGAPVMTTVTGQAGSYTAEDLLEDVYLLVFSAPGHRTVQTSARVTTGKMTGAGAHLGVSAGTIEGTVTDLRQAEPLIDTRIILYDQDNLAFADTLTDGNGYFVVPGLPVGSYKVVAHKDGYADGWQGAASVAGQTASVEIALVPVQGEVTGTVSDEDGKPVSAAVTAHTIAGLPLFTQVVDNVGRYALAGLGPGAYFLQVRAAGYAAVAVDFIAAPGAARPLDVRLAKTRGAVGGRITTDTGPAAGVAITATHLGGRSLARTITDPDGRYLLEDLPTGELALIAGGFGLVTRAFPLVLAAGVRLGYPIRLQSDPCGILQRVNDAQGYPAAGAQVRVADAAGRYLCTVLTDRAGFFWLRAWSRGGPRPAPWQWSS